MNKEDYFDAEYVRSHFRMSESTLYRRINDCRFPKPIRYGKQRLWPKEVILDFEKRMNEVSRKSYRVTLYA